MVLDMALVAPLSILTGIWLWRRQPWGAALTGGETAQPANRTMKHAIWNNMFVIVFDPNRIGAAERFAQEARAFTEWVEASPLSGATDRIMMPGDPERRARAARAQGLPIDLGTMDELDAAARAVDPALPALSSLATGR
jgi:uncharacterized oxidoreductase